MKQHRKLLLLICIFFIHSNDSFSPRPVLPATHSSGKYPLFYRYANVAEETTVNKQDSLHHHDSFLSTILREGHSDAAKRIALDAQENVQVYDSLRGEKTKRAWQSLVPLIPGERGFDITVKWSSPEDGSKLLLQHLFLKQQPLLQRQLQESFETFQSLLPSYSQFKARIVSTRGSSGTKCPRYHVDHVPMRWVQALVGPGCDYVVGSDGISWEAINGMEERESCGYPAFNRMTRRCTDGCKKRRWQISCSPQVSNVAPSSRKSPADFRCCTRVESPQKDKCTSG